MIRDIEYPHWIESFYQFYPVVRVLEYVLEDENVGSTLVEVFSREDELMLDITGCIDSHL
jgi:hypothetical protein